MLRRFRRRAPGGHTQDWFETDAAGAVLRQASFRPDLVPDVLARESGPRQAGTDGAACVAASRAELTALCEDFGSLAVRLYRAVYGSPLTTATEASREPGATQVHVTSGEFERAWTIARRDRHFTPCDRGPLPAGASVTGTVAATPWGIGVTGLLVELPLPVQGFVDMGQLGAAENWPAVGTLVEFEVLGVRFNAGRRPRPQVRLRPKAVRAPGRA
ncbi:hypothetical protein DSC45_31880 [Streptomyces sp. YIM 130001]|uniref:hypothetical protein n=1 Tax=Streptomyces sp. YIM 130001 TaxID=2259644 RepID=UPI000E6556F3|nr:hypothetical protein [Streptomyces sp. YIM 130001]RII09290.1 hypothetical protein DSC45_31880 [Streptomyces sp. YIM 130001]